MVSCPISLSEDGHILSKTLPSKCHHNWDSNRRLSHSLHHNLCRLLTTVRTLPGFWMRSAFTTWNTSTMPSVLQHSVALMNEQNTPHRLTVSLCAVSAWKEMKSLLCTGHTRRERPQPAGSPAMDHDGSVPSSPLYHQHLLNDCHDGRRGGAQTLRGPAGHLKLSHLVILTRLEEEEVWGDNGYHSSRPDILKDYI